jgi:hypothetical protein
LFGALSLFINTSGLSNDVSDDLSLSTTTPGLVDPDSTANELVTVTFTFSAGIECCHETKSHDSCINVLNPVSAPLRSSIVKYCPAKLS